jgi:uncharacterized protein YmfQ (DUF2313 family)
MIGGYHHLVRYAAAPITVSARLRFHQARDLPVPPVTTLNDGWTQHAASDYATALADLLPTGPAWPRDLDAPLMLWVGGASQIWGDVDARAADLLTQESDPRSALELLPDWERNWGLPDPCLAEKLTIGDREIALVAKMTTLGGQSRPFFLGVAATLGYSARITEYAPFMCGISRCGDTRDVYGDWRWQLAQPTIRFYWTVHIGSLRNTPFRVGGGGGQCGIDPLLRIAMATDLVCLLTRWAPAHTQVIFDYSAVGGTPPEPPEANAHFLGRYAAPGGNAKLAALLNLTIWNP